MQEGHLYTDSAYTNAFEDHGEVVNVYLKEYTNHAIMIYDHSVNGSVQPSIAWNSTSKYNYNTSSW